MEEKKNRKKRMITDDRPPSHIFRYRPQEVSKEFEKLEEQRKKRESVIFGKEDDFLYYRYKKYWKPRGKNKK